MRISNILVNSIKFCFSTNKNLYSVRSDASEDEIKKAFRQIAQKYHPDKNPDPKAQQKFVSAKQAYQTLTDIDKRRQYDNQNNYQNRSYGFDKNPFDEFNEDVFKDKSRVHHETYSTGSVRRKKGQNINQQIKISFQDSVKGIKYKINFQRRSTCQVCNGNRCKPGTAPTRCLSCGGSGSTIYRQGSIVMHLQCSRCNGIGLIIKNPCTACNGKGINLTNDQQQLQIPSGIDNGQVLTFRGKGNQSQNGPSGDLNVKVNVEKHKAFRRNGNNIESTQWITVSQAALGAKKQMNTIWGKDTLFIDEGSQDGKKIILKGKGVKKEFDEGDHICVIRIKIPTKLTTQQRQIFGRLAKTEQKIIVQQQEEDSNFRKFKNIFK